MEFTLPLKMNYDFRRAYRKGRSAAEPCLVVYARRNGSQQNRVGYTVSNIKGKPTNSEFIAMIADCMSLRRKASAEPAST